MATTLRRPNSRLSFADEVSYRGRFIKVYNGLLICDNLTCLLKNFLKCFNQLN